MRFDESCVLDYACTRADLLGQHCCHQVFQACSGHYASCKSRLSAVLKFLAGFENTCGIHVCQSLSSKEVKKSNFRQYGQLKSRAEK